MIRSAYLRAGMNRSQFQRAIGVAYSTILNWERGRTRPNADHLERIADVTGLSVSEVLTGDAEGAKASEPAYAALRELMATPVAKQLTVPERRTIEGITFHGVEPTLATYHAILIGLRLASHPVSRKRKAPKKPRARG